MLSGNSVSATKAEAKQPLFARSVEEASLPVSNWASPQPHVAYYDPMMKLRTTPSRLVAPATESPRANAPEASSASAPHSAPHHAAPAQTGSAPPQAAPPREIVRDIPQQTKPSRRNRNTHTRENAATEQVDPQDAYAKVDRDPRSRDRQRNTTQVDNDRPNAGPRRSERRYGSRDDAESVDARSRSDRRRADVDDERPRRGERRVIVQDEPEPRIVRGPEARDGGFSPFRLFGIFER
jgi:hypothetical protein